MEVRDSGVQGEEFLCSFPALEAQLASFLLPGGSVRLLHQIVTAGGGDDLNVLHGVEHGNLTQRRPIAPQLVGMDHLRHVVFPQEADKKGLGRLGVSVFLKQNVQHVPVFVDRSPQPMLDPADLDADLIQMPSRTPPGFSMAQFLGQEWGELDVPLPQRFVTDLDAALVEQLLNVPLAEGEAVVQPQSVADHAQGKTVAVGLPVSHSSPAYRG
ncbi:hypothetical protein DEGR_38190 (plasmid) [Deinococcus grandis]|nr:hypothetical protein DEGR_38190 [Deinococcus grandis]